MMVDDFPGEEPKRAAADTFHPVGPFQSTLWAQLKLCQDPEDPGYRETLEALCDRYWPPVYFFIRRNWNKDPEEAKDLCQSFFLRFLDPAFLRSASTERGRFRNFVCGSLLNFLRNAHRDENRLKRRPASGPVLSIDSIREDCEGFDLPDPGGGEGPPEAELESLWKRALVRNAIERLRELGERDGKSDQVEIFVRYRLHVEEGKPPTRAALAESFGLSPSQVNRALGWARDQFLPLLEAEVRDQVSSEEEFRAEMRDLFGC